MRDLPPDILGLLIGIGIGITAVYALAVLVRQWVAGPVDFHRDEYQQSDRWWK